MILGQDGDCALGIIEGHIVYFQKWRVRLAIQLCLPEINPLLYGITRLLGVEWLLSHADQLEGGHVQHLLKSARVVSSLDDLQRDAVTDPEDRGRSLGGKCLVLLGRPVPFLQFLSRLAELVLELYVFLVGAQGVIVVVLVLVLGVFALSGEVSTRLMGLRRNLIFFCSLSSSLPFMPSTSSALFVLFLPYSRGTASPASGRHPETSCRACAASSRWSPGTTPGPARETSATTPACPGAPS
jgi:hypothetical protein